MGWLSGRFLPRSLAINDSVKLAPLDPPRFGQARRVFVRRTSRVGPLRIIYPTKSVVWRRLFKSLRRRTDGTL
jgi:hypothetical protein